LQVKPNTRSSRIEVTGDGAGVVGHAGGLVLVELAERIGLAGGLSAAMKPTRQRRSAHDPGQVLVDLAVMLADGGDSLSDLRVLREQPELFGQVASDATTWRVLDAIDEATRGRIDQARAKARAAAWAAGVRPSWVVLDIDSTLITAHSDKELAAPTYKHGFGFHPIACFLDQTNEALAGILRPGNAGSGTATDHIAVLDQALAQLPVKTKTTDPAAGEWMLVRGDSAACSHEFLDAVRDRGLEFSVGFTLTETVRDAVLKVPEKQWIPAVTQDPEEEREGAWVAEITDALDLSGWPEGSRVIVRRERAHPGAQLTFTDADGHRFQAFLTDSPEGDIVFLEARHRGHARVEDRIRLAKDSGMRNLPFGDFARNHAWLLLVLLSADLVAWCQRLLLDGELRVAEPKRLRYTLWHCAGRLVRTGRRIILRLQETWPWTKELVTAFDRLRSIDFAT
jgi:hypothetical protein